MSLIPLALVLVTGLVSSLVHVTSARYVPSGEVELSRILAAIATMPLPDRVDPDVEPDLPAHHEADSKGDFAQAKPSWDAMLNKGRNGLQYRSLRSLLEQMQT